MQSSERILVAVDDSPGSEKAVEYVGRLLAGARSSTLRLFHVVEPIAPSWDCVHGTLDTESPEPPGSPLTHLIEEAKKRSGPVLDAMLGVLARAGLAPERVERTWFTAQREDTLGFEILKLAREERYGTVVVGRSALPWYRELFHRHLGEQLVREGDGLSIWVVE